MENTSKQKESPDAWVPIDYHRITNLKEDRERYQSNWEKRTENLNNSRSLVNKIRGKGKTTAHEVMLLEAEKDDQEWEKERARNHPLREGIPDILYHQEHGRHLLKFLGIQEPYFESADDLKAALAKGLERKGLSIYEADLKVQDELKPRAAEYHSQAREMGDLLSRANKGS